MCGIAGYIGWSKISSKRVEQCLELMNRRGPDARGVFEHSLSTGWNVCLLHTRLSIIDLDERANQPFRSGSRVLTYNGEIYNYVELRNEVAKRGHSFLTSSDTEVLIKVLEEYGSDGLDKCEGMWAFSVYDEKDGTLILSRDRFGRSRYISLKMSQGSILALKSNSFLH